ncbi:hypothetical protein PQR51_06495 [Caballeronia grimmiae]
MRNTQTARLYHGEPFGICSGAYLARRNARRHHSIQRRFQHRPRISERIIEAQVDAAPPCADRAERRGAGACPALLMITENSTLDGYRQAKSAAPLGATG